jgi:DNA-binding IscR family transcriptional regulator
MVATRLAVATHILLLLTRSGSDGPATSQRLALSVNTNPVVVRRIAGMLVRGGLIHIRRGRGGAALARPAAEISLEDVWRAVNPGKGRLLPLHRPPEGQCAVGMQIHTVLGQAFGTAEHAMRQALAGMTLDRLGNQLGEGL